MSTQRMKIYEQRREVLQGEDLSEDIASWIDGLVERTVYEHTQSEYQEEWDLESLFKEMSTIYETEIEPDELRGLPREELIAEFQDDARDAYAAKEEEFGSELMREIERYLVLQVVDVRWREHLDSMEYLRDGIHLRAMAQKDPLAEYRSEGHDMFEELRDMIREEVVRYLFHVEVQREDAPAALQPQAAPDEGLVYAHESLAGADAIQAAGSNGGGGEAAAGVTTATATQQRVASDWDRVGRNDACPCGSGKKFKKCHGA
jgi:preprotein translocase subunit SecA